jgi:hypothetical protein
MDFDPKFTITPKNATLLMRIETARLDTTHYSTMIEGNRLTGEQVSRGIDAGEHFPGRERDENPA